MGCRSSWVILLASAALVIACGADGNESDGSSSGGSESSTGGTSATGGVPGSAETGSGGDGAVGTSGGSAAKAVGEPCTPTGHDFVQFGGFSKSEVNIEVPSPSCSSEICLSNHFQGRVTCPYGQTEGELESLPADSEFRCRTSSGEAVIVPVTSQLLERRSVDAVFCSCRCAGPDPDADYCDCPSSMDCVELVENLGLGDHPYAGSYCIPPGTEYKAEVPLTASCDRELRNCE